MSQYQNFKSIKPSNELEDYLHEKCKSCGGQGWEYTSSGFPLHSISCSSYGGTGHGKVNNSKLCKLLNI